MKKVFAGLFIMMMGLFFVACSGAGDIKGVIEKAKAEGANWTEAQWKDAFKEVMNAAKPMFSDMQEMQKKVEAAGSDAEAIGKIMEDAQKLQDKYKDLGAQFEEFEKIVEANPTAKKIMDDKAFQEELKKDLGFDLSDL